VEERKENDSKKVPREVQFLDIIFMLSQAAFQHLGEIPNPVNNKVEVDLDAAKFSIDALDVIKKKTKGNLTSDEDKVLDDLLYNLRMKYLEVYKKH
jgi:hypothetical protein